MPDQRLFSFGLITDVQYADVANCQNYKKTAWRYYRKALPCLEKAIDHWNSDQDTLFTLQLGDLIDGQSRKNGWRDNDWKKLQDVFAKYKKPVMHCVGNHDLYNFSRDELMSTFIYPDPEKLLFSDCDHLIPSTVKNSLVMISSKTISDAKLCCYHFSPYPGFRFVNLDCYDESTLGRNANDVKFKEAMEFLKERNPNKDKNAPENALHPRFVAYNGGVGREQLAWLDNVLSESDQHDERVVVFGHMAAHPSSAGETTLLWNYKEVLELLWKHRSVVLYLAGHDHDDGAYCCDESGIHYCTFNSLVQAVPNNEGGNETAYAIVDVYKGGMEIRGFGDITSHALKFRTIPTPIFGTVTSLYKVSLQAVALNLNLHIKDIKNLPPHTKKRLVYILSKRGLLDDKNILECLHLQQKELDLSDCHITDSVLTKIASVCKYLVKVDLNSAKENRISISTQGIVKLAEGCKWLQIVFLRRCTFLTDDAVISLAVNCANLKQLNLGGCQNISDASLRALGENCSKLESINVSSTQVSDDGVFELCRSENSKVLKELHLAECQNISDEAVTTVMEHCINIEILLFHGCPKITEKSRIALEILFQGSAKMKQITWTIY